MPNSSIPFEYEKALMPFCSIVNKLKRIGVLTDALVAAATSVDDLIADTYAALLSGTIEKYPPEVRNLVRCFEQGVNLMETLGLITDVLAAALTTVNTASASTDLQYLAAGVITVNGFDRTDESYFEDAVYAYGVTG